MKRFGVCLVLGATVLLAEEKPAPPTGMIAGKVSWEGAIPVLKPLEVDPTVARGCACAPNGPDGKKHTKPNEALLVDPEGKGVANAVLWLKGVKGGLVLGPVEIDQKDCVFSPHVSLITPGQKVRILNPEKIVHNFHLRGKVDGNLVIPRYARNPGEIPMKEVPAKHVSEAEFIYVTCDIHSGWMSCWIAVMENGWAAKTDAKGAFRIEGVPPGKYVLALWHEKIERDGKPFLMEQEVVVGAGKETTTGFTLKADAP